MTLGTEETNGFVALHRGAIEQTQHTTHFLIEFLRGIFSLLDGLFVGRCQIISIVGVRLAHRQTVSPRTELQVESIAYSLIGIVATSPVADYHTIEAPVLLQNLVEHNIIVAVVLVFIEVVGTHDSPCTTLLHSSLEGRQVNLMQGAVADNNIYLMTVFFIVVQRIVFHTGSDTLRLQSLNVWYHHP